MLILLLAGVVLAFFLQRYLYRTYWKKGLSVTVEFQEPYVYEGDHSRLREVLINDKRLPLPSMEVGLAMSRNLRFRQEASENTSVTDQTYKRDVFSFLSRQQITRTLPFEAVRRGFYQIDKAAILCSDLLLMEYYHEEFPQSTQIYVYPRQVDTSRISLVCSAISGMILAHNRIYQDPFEFSGIREYRKEDPMNRINWKASARSQQLMVNQYDATTNIDVTLLLELEDRTILKHRDLVEESIRIVSSLSAALVKGKMDFSIRSNCKDPQSESGFSMDFQGAGAYLGELNKKLACMDPEQITLSAAEFLSAEAEIGRSGHTYVLVSKNQTEDIVSALMSLVGSDNRVLWIVPISPYDKKENLRLNHVQQIFWEVTE